MGTADHGDGKIASGMFSNTCGWAPSGSAKYQFILIKKKKKSWSFSRTSPSTVNCAKWYLSRWFMILIQRLGSLFRRGLISLEMRIFPDISNMSKQ